MKKYIKPILFVVLALLATPSFAALSPVSISIVPPIQFPPEDFAVTGLRASLLWGEHRNMSGIDLGLIGNITEQSFTGIGISGLFNYTQGTTNIIGLQLAGLTNINSNKLSVYGIQAAILANINPAESTVVGLQLALANLSAFTNVYGLQVGLFNKARVVHGFQIGIINVTESLHGIQIGLLNFNHTGMFVVSPIINVGF